MCKCDLRDWNRKATRLYLVTKSMKMLVPLGLKLAGLSFLDKIVVSL